MNQRLGPNARRLLRAPARLYDWHAGWLLGPRFVRLTHVGRRSGRRHRTILELIGNDRATGELIVLVGMGPTADWFRNIQHGPAVGRLPPVPGPHPTGESLDSAVRVVRFRGPCRWIPRSGYRGVRASSTARGFM